MAPRLLTYAFFTIVTTAWTVLLAFRRRPNFYSAAVYLSKSYGCMLVLYNFALLCTITFGKALQFVFFGQLRMIEAERLTERAWYSLTETLLSLTTFRDDFGPGFVAILATLFFVKVFHWLASDRIEMMEQNPNQSRMYHARMIILLFLLWAIDSLLLLFTIESILLEGPSVMIMVSSEYMILLTTIWSISIKYGLNMYEVHRGGPWEQKSIYFFYVDIITDFAKFLTYLTFFFLILTFYGFPINLIRDLVVTGVAVFRRVRDLMRYREATRDMERRYPSVKEEELSGGRDRTCIICREEMHGVGSPELQQQQASHGAVNETPKKLPCGHIFHFHCLKSWLERQQSCPTCRASVLQQRPNQVDRPANNPNPNNINNNANAVPPPGGVGPNDPAVRRAAENLVAPFGALFGVEAAAARPELTNNAARPANGDGLNANTTTAQPPQFNGTSVAATQNPSATQPTDENPLLTFNPSTAMAATDDAEGYFYRLNIEPANSVGLTAATLTSNTANTGSWALPDGRILHYGPEPMTQGVDVGRTPANAGVRQNVATVVDSEARGGMNSVPHSRRDTSPISNTLTRSQSQGVVVVPNGAPTTPAILTRTTQTSRTSESLSDKEKREIMLQAVLKRAVSPMVPKPISTRSTTAGNEKLMMDGASPFPTPLTRSISQPIALSSQSSCSETTSKIPTTDSPQSSILAIPNSRSATRPDTAPPSAPPFPTADSSFWQKDPIQTFGPNQPGIPPRTQRFNFSRTFSPTSSYTSQSSTHSSPFAFVRPLPTSIGVPQLIPLFDPANPSAHINPQEVLSRLATRPPSTFDNLDDVHMQRIQKQQSGVLQSLQDKLQDMMKEVNKLNTLSKAVHMTEENLNGLEQMLQNLDVGSTSMAPMEGTRTTEAKSTDEGIEKEEKGKGKARAEDW